MTTKRTKGYVVEFGGIVHLYGGSLKEVADCALDKISKELDGHIYLTSVDGQPTTFLFDKHSPDLTEEDWKEAEKRLKMARDK